MRESMPGPLLYQGLLPHSGPFVGRSSELHTLNNSLQQANGVLIEGAGGLGKSSLALHLADQWHAQGYHVLGWHGRVNVEILLETILQAFLGSWNNTPTAIRTVDLQQKFDLVVQQFLNQRPVLLVLDNFEDNLSSGAQVLDARLRYYLRRLLLNLKGDSRLLITSRSEVPIPELEVFELQPLCPEEALLKLQSLQPLKQVPLDIQDVLVERSGGNPRHLELLNDQIAASPTPQALAQTVQELLTSPGQTTEQWLLRRLWNEQLTPSQRQLLTVGALFEAPFGLEALQAVLEHLPNDDLKPLTRLALLQWEPDTECLYVHRLTATFVLEPAQTPWAIQQELHLKIAAWYEQQAHQLRSIPNFLASHHHYRQGNNFNKLAEITFFAQDLLKLRGYIDQARSMNQEMLEITPDEDVRGACCHNLGILEQEQGKLSEAQALFEEAQKTFERTGNQNWGSKTLHQLGMLAQLTGDTDKALYWYELAHQSFTALGEVKGLAALSHQAGLIHQTKGQLREAFQAFETARELFSQLKNQQLGIASALAQIGILYQMEGKYPLALQTFAEALKMFKELDYPNQIASVYAQVGSVYLARGELEKAERMYQQALPVFEQLQNQSARATTYLQLGLIQRLNQRWPEAFSRFDQAQQVFQELGQQPGLAQTFYQQALAHQGAQQREQALALGQQAHQLLVAQHSPLAGEVQAWLTGL